MRRSLVWALLAAVPVPPAAAQTVPMIFSDGFEQCCTVGGTVAGLAGSGLVLRLAAGSATEDRAITANGPWRFTTPLTHGTDWSVSIQSQPSAGPACQLSNAAGTMGSSHVVDVAVYCASALQWDAGEWGQLWQ